MPVRNIKLMFKLRFSVFVVVFSAIYLLLCTARNEHNAIPKFIIECGNMLCDESQQFCDEGMERCIECDRFCTPPKLEKKPELWDFCSKKCKGYLKLHRRPKPERDPKHSSDGHDNPGRRGKGSKPPDGPDHPQRRGKGSKPSDGPDHPQRHWETIPLPALLAMVACVIVTISALICVGCTTSKTPHQSEDRAAYVGQRAEENAGLLGQSDNSLPGGIESITNQGTNMGDTIETAGASAYPLPNHCGTDSSTPTGSETAIEECADRYGTRTPASNECPEYLYKNNDVTICGLSTTCD